MTDDTARFGGTDPDTAPIASTGGRTIWDEIDAAIDQQEVGTPETVTFALSRWPAWHVTYRLPATAPELRQIAESTLQEMKKDGNAYNRRLLARCCIGIAFNGVDLVEDDGAPVTWASERIRARANAKRSTEALTFFYRGGIKDGPGDGEIVEHANELTTRAGFGDNSQVWEIKSDDPT